MTTKPTAKKFRIRRSASLLGAAMPGRGEGATVVAGPGSQRGAVPPAPPPQAGAQTQAAAPADPGVTVPQRNARRPALDAAADPANLFTPPDDGFGPEIFPTARSAAATPAPSPALSPEAEIDSIRRESLTGRQLRMARRMAQKHNLPATSDFDAVRLLRRAGIDPFQRSNMLELVVGDAAPMHLPPPGPAGPAAPASPPAGLVQLPQTVKPAPVPSTDVRAAEARADSIYRIQRDIARRRRRRMALLAARLTFFVMLPTLLAGIYYYTIATPLYSTRSEFVIQQAESAAGGALGGLFSGTQFATSQDSITVQSYLQSRDAMLRLDRDLGFKAHFSQPQIDPLQRLEADSTNEAAYKVYKRNVKIGFDPTEGIVKMEVIAADPATSAAFSEHLISYAEEQVDQLTQRLREDQMSGARDSYEDAEAKMLAAQRRVVELQERFKVVSSEVEVSMVASQITALEAQMTEERLRLQELLANPSPSAARVDPVRNRIANLEAEIAMARAKLTEDGDNGVSLAEVQSELLVAQADVQTRQLMLAQSLQSLETSRIEANRQVRYLSMGVRPVAPDEATYPRAFENTAVAFLIFGGIYLMLSMTASILREQVSA